jgi:hypothetical protein
MIETYASPHCTYMFGLTAIVHILVYTILIISSHPPMRIGYFLCTLYFKDANKSDWSP